MARTRRRGRLVAAFLTLTGLCFAPPSSADPLYPPRVWVADASGGLGLLDLASGQVEVTGQALDVLTDIATGPDGLLYGISFTRLYRVVPNGALKDLGPHSVPCGNALEIAPSGDVAYAMGCSGDGLYELDLSGGGDHLVMNTGYTSAGDLAWANGELYLAASGAGSSVLVALDPHAGGVRLVGEMGVPNIYGLVADRSGALYAGAGSAYFQVDKTTGAATRLGDYSGPLGAAYGWAIDPGDPAPVS